MFLIGRTSTPGESISTRRQVMPSCPSSTSKSVRVRRMIHLNQAARRGPDLLSVDDILVAVADGLALEGREIAADRGLGVSGAPLVAAIQDFRQELGLLLLGAVLDDGGADPLEAHHAEAERRSAGLRHLLLEDDLLHDAAATAAVLVRPAEADPALLADGLEPVTEEAGVFAGVLREVLAMKSLTSSRKASSSLVRVKSISNLRWRRRARSGGRALHRH